jgi:hypothetical protein
MAAAIEAGKQSTAYVGTGQYYDQRAKALELDQQERQRRMQERIDDLLKKIQEGKITKAKASTELKDIFGDVGLDLDVAQAQGYSFMESFSSGFMDALNSNINATFANMPKAIMAALNVLAQSAAYKKAQDALNNIMNPSTDTRTIKGQTMVDLLAARISDTKNLQTKLREYYALIKPEVGMNDPERVKRFKQIGGFLAELERLKNFYTPGGKYTSGQYDDLNVGFMEKFGSLLQLVMSSLAGYYPGTKAMGGGLFGGTQYMVGERGPEMLTMFKGGGGYVTPNHRLPSSLRSSAGALRAGAYGRAVGGYVGYGGPIREDSVTVPTPGPTPEPSWIPWEPSPTPTPTPTGTPTPTPTPTAGPEPKPEGSPWGMFPFNFRMYTKWINSVIPMGGIGRIYGGPNGEFTGYNKGTTIPFEGDDGFAVVKRPTWWDRFKDRINVRKIAPFDWKGPGNIKTWSPKSGFVPGVLKDLPNGKVKLIPGNAMTKAAATTMAQAFRGTVILSTGLSAIDIATASERGESPARAWVRNIAMNVGALAMAVPNIVGVVGSGGTAIAAVLAANAVVATALDALAGGAYDLLFGNVWDGKQTQQSIDMGQERSLGFFGDIFNYNKGFNPAQRPRLTPGNELLNLPSPTVMPKLRFGGGRAEGGPVDVGRGYDGTLSWLEDYTDPATRFIHQILPPGKSNSNLAGIGGFVDILSSLYKAGLSSIMPGPDLADALARLAGSGKLPGPLEALARNMAGLSQLSNVSRPMSLRDMYELDPAFDLVKRGIWDRGSRPLATGVIRSVVGGLDTNYEHLGGLLSGRAEDLATMGGPSPITSVVTRRGYKPPNVTTSFNDFLSGDYHFPFLATDPASFPESKRVGLSSALPQGGVSASKIAEFQIPGGIPIDQIETILGLPTMADENNQYRPFTDAERAARAAKLAEMGFTDLGNMAIATDVLNQQIADWRNSSGSLPVDPQAVAEMQARIVEAAATGRIYGGRESQAAQLLRAGVLRSPEEAALYAATADEHFKRVRARLVETEAERTRNARTVAGKSFADRVAEIRERLIFTQPELFTDLPPAVTEDLVLKLVDAPEIKPVGGEQLDLFKLKSNSGFDVEDIEGGRRDSVRMRPGEGLRGRPVRTGTILRQPSSFLGKILHNLGVFGHAGTTEVDSLGAGPGRVAMGKDFPGYLADTISFDWGDLRIPHDYMDYVDMASIDAISSSARLALAAAPFGMFDPSDPSKRLLIDIVDQISGESFAGRVTRSDSNYIQLRRSELKGGAPDTVIHEIGHLMHNNAFGPLKVLRSLVDPEARKLFSARYREVLGIFEHKKNPDYDDQGRPKNHPDFNPKPYTIKDTLFGHVSALKSAFYEVQDHLQNEQLIRAYERALIAQGLNPIQARVEATSLALNHGLGKGSKGYQYTMPRDFPRPTTYSGTNIHEHFAEIFAGHTMESLPDDMFTFRNPLSQNLSGRSPTHNWRTSPPELQAEQGVLQSAGQMLDLEYTRGVADIASGALPDPNGFVERAFAARSQYPRELAREYGFRAITDPGAVAAGLMPELYTPKSRRVPVPFTGGKLSLKGMQAWTPDQGGFKGTAAKADSFVGTKKGNFLSGFLADVGMMAASGNWDFAQLIPSLAFNLLSILPKIGGPAAMIAGLLTTGATGGDMGRAAAGTVGSLVGGLLGNLIPIPFIGGMVGSILGGMLGDFIYTNFINPESANQGTQMIQAGGGAVYNVGPNAPFPFNSRSNVPFSGEPTRKIGGRAFGGAVRPNLGYMVGERGPELLVPGGLGGSIIPNHKLRAPSGVSPVAGGQTVNASVVINNPNVSNAGDIDKLAKKVAEAQTRALRSAGYVRPK